MEPIVVAIVGVLGAVVGATLSSWLGAREAVAQELRELRLKTYPSVWRRTAVVSRWPRTDATPSNLGHLHRDLREWYYVGGGLYLSANARVRYEELQTLLEAYVVSDSTEARLADPVYDAVMNAASAFRTSLTEDLQSRQQRSLLSAIRLGRTHARQRAAAQARREAAPRADVPPRHVITPADEELRLPSGLVPGEHPDRDLGAAAEEP